MVENLDDKLIPKGKLKAARLDREIDEWLGVEESQAYLAEVLGIPRENLGDVLEETILRQVEKSGKTPEDVKH